MMEREIIYQVLEEAHGNQRKAARLLGVRPNTLHYKIQRMGLVPVHKYMLPEELPEVGRRRTPPTGRDPRLGGTGARIDRPLSRVRRSALARPFNLYKRILFS